MLNNSTMLSYGLKKTKDDSFFVCLSLDDAYFKNLMGNECAYMSKPAIVLQIMCIDKDRAILEIIYKDDFDYC